MTAEQNFFEYWQQTGKRYLDGGDYAWMAQQLRAFAQPAAPVIEVGCGLGYSTAALVAAGFKVLPLDVNAECLQATATRCGIAGLPLDIMQLQPAHWQQLNDFAAHFLVCWLMGDEQQYAQRTPAAVAQPADDSIRMARQVLTIASQLPTVTHVQFVTRTVIPWQAKDIARQQLLERYRQLLEPVQATQANPSNLSNPSNPSIDFVQSVQPEGSSTPFPNLEETRHALPFSVDMANILLRKFEADPQERQAFVRLRQQYAHLKSITPVFTSVILART